MSGLELRALPDADCVLMNICYLAHPNQDSHGAGTSPTYGLTVLQGAQLAGALHAQILSVRETRDAHARALTADLVRGRRFKVLELHYISRAASSPTISKLA